LFFHSLITLKSYSYIFIIFALTFFNTDIHAAYNAPSVIKTSATGLKITWSGPSIATIQRWEIIKDNTTHIREDYNTTHAQWSNLSPGVRKYRLNVCISNNCEFTPWSSPVALEGYVSSKAPIVSSRYGDVTFNWQSFGGNNNSRYDLYVEKDGKTKGPDGKNYIFPHYNKTSHISYNLGPGTRRYRINECVEKTITGVVCKGASAWSNYIHVVEKLAKPTTYSEGADMHTSWPTLQAGQGFNVTYDLRVLLKNESDVNATPLDIDVTQYINDQNTQQVFWSMTPGIRQYSVRACIDNSCGKYSDYSDPVTIKTTPFQQVNIQGDSVELSWLEIGASHGYEIELYKAESPYKTLTTNTNTYTIFDLPSGDYSVKYRINSKQGWSKPSSSKTFTIVAPFVEPPTITPNGGAIVSGTTVSFSASGATTQYALLNVGAHCSNANSWKSASNVQLENAQRICVKAVTTGGDESEVVFADFDVSSAKQIIFIHTDALGSPQVETNDKGEVQ
jgi:hypothetical protein